MTYSNENHQMDLFADKAVNGTYKMSINATIDGSEVKAGTDFTVLVRVLPWVKPPVAAPVLKKEPKKKEIFDAPVEVVNVPEVDLSKYTYKQRADKKKADKPLTVTPTPMTDLGEIGLSFSIPARAPKDGKLPANMRDAIIIDFVP